MAARAPERSATEAAHRRGWWSRNWKWLVPVLAVFGLAAFAAAILGFLMFVMNLMRGSPPYQEAMHRARQSPQLIAAIGTPIEAGMFLQGNIGYSGADGSADLRIPVHGPRGSATVIVVAERERGTWHYSVLAVDIDATHQRIDLLPRHPPPDHAATTILQASAASCSTTSA